ncbi:hypothetical protein [Methylomonas sp. AM2-LC]|uniref:hypothetical protein n=1 Tax=Methylomonas sp. AM2-LC TaxID=3153301 RepID=UPI00326690EA
MNIDTEFNIGQIDVENRLHRKTASNAIKRLVLASRSLSTGTKKITIEPTLSISPIQANQFHRKAATYAIFGDLLFIVLPLVVISIVDVSVGKSLFALIETPELSFGSAVLFGQTIIKVVSGFANSKPSGAEQPVFVVAMIIVFGLVPSLVVLALLLSINPAPYGLQLAQAIIFAFGVIVFFIFGVTGHAQSLHHRSRLLKILEPQKTDIPQN